MRRIEDPETRMSTDELLCKAINVTLDLCQHLKAHGQDDPAAIMVDILDDLCHLRQDLISGER